MRDEADEADGRAAALARVAAVSFFRCFKRAGREPDLWESWHMLMACQALEQRRFRDVVRCIEVAMLPRRQRPLVGNAIAKPPAGLSGVRLEVLQALFSGARSAKVASVALH